MKKVELLAPAGNMKCLKAAIEAGCDAVYLAGNCFTIELLNISDITPL